MDPDWERVVDAFKCAVDATADRVVLAATAECEFAAAVEACSAPRSDEVDAAWSRLDELKDAALAEIHRVLTDPNASWEATMRASEVVLDLCYGTGGSA